MKILATGAAGFIGTNYVYHELSSDQDSEIIGLDSFTYAGNPENLLEAARSRRFTFYKEDITNKENIESIFAAEKPDVVVNFAAESHVDRSIEKPSEFMITNILGTQVLMDACLKSGVKRFHQVSTDEVYGDLPLDRPDLLFSESTPLKASSPYSASKAAADLLVHSYIRTYELPATISRCSNNYGPFQFPEKLIPLCVAKAQKDLQLPVYGEGKNVRDWLHVLDHCSAISLIVRKGKVGEVYNIGGNNEWKNIDVVKTILALLNKPEGLITYVEDRKGHDLRYAINAEKIRNELGWEPKIPFKEGIALTIEWYTENLKWIENIISGEYQSEEIIRALTVDSI